MRTYEFWERFAFSVGTNGRTFEQIIQQTLPGIISVRKTNPEEDKTGIDYKAVLRRGAEINIDLKLREKGCSKFWQSEEEIALEKWSVVPEKGKAGKVGWTLDEAKQTHYTLHAFDRRDSENVFLLPFQLLRKAFRTHMDEWYTEYESARQNSGTWRSECLFVPISVVLEAIREASCHEIENALFKT